MEVSIFFFFFFFILGILENVFGLFWGGICLVKV